MNIAVFDNKELDIQLNAIGYRIRGYQRSELSSFIPRLGAGEQTDSQFDLLRSASVKGFSGGELQRYWNDESSVFGIEGLENRYDDGVLYPTNTMSTTDGVVYGTVKVKMTAWTRSSDYLYVASVTLNTPTTTIKRIKKDGTTTSLTLPTSLQNNEVTGMCVAGTRLWITCAGYSSAIYYMDISSTTVNEITGGSGRATKLVYYRGEVYGTHGSNLNTYLYRYTGSTSTRSWELVGTTDKDSDSTANLFVYNNRIFLTRRDGMYAYDGIQMNIVEDMAGSENVNNYLCPAVLKGYLYYFMPDGYYRFNGSLIEKIYDISECGLPSGVAYGENRLWYVYRNSEYAGSSRYDKSMGYDFESGDDVQGRVAFFDGKGLFTYARLTTYDKGTITEDFAGQGEPDGIIYFNGTVYVTTWYSQFADNLHYSTSPVASARAVTIVTSIYDGGFPQVFKELEETEIALDGATSTSDTFIVYARTETTVGGFEGDGGWQQVGTCTVAGNKIMPIWDTTIGELRFKKIQFKISCSSLNSTVGIEKFIIRFTLCPEYKFQWQFTVLCYGDSAPLMYQNTEEATNTVDTLRGNIYQSRESDFPVSFLDIDYLLLDGAINSSVTTININSDKILKADEGFIQIGSEVMRYYRDSETSLVVDRGQLGTTATSHADGDAIYLFYRVILRQIMNERIELEDEEKITNSRNRDSEITILIQEV